MSWVLGIVKCDKDVHGGASLRLTCIKIKGGDSCLPEHGLT